MDYCFETCETGEIISGCSLTLDPKDIDACGNVSIRAFTLDTR